MSSGPNSSARELDTTRSELEGATVLAFRGELNLATAPELCRELDEASIEWPRVVVDLRDVTSSDTSGVRALIGAAQEAAIRMSRLVLVVGRSSGLARLLEISGARELLAVETTLRRAAATIGRSSGARLATGHRTR